MRGCLPGGVYRSRSWSLGNAEQLLSKLQQLQRNDPELYEKESPDL